MKVSETLPPTRITARRLGGAGEQAIFESKTESAMPKACTAESGARQSRLKRSSLTFPIWKRSSSSCSSGTSWMFLTWLGVGVGVGAGVGVGVGLGLGLGLGLGVRVGCEAQVRCRAAKAEDLEEDRAHLQWVVGGE